MLKIQANQNMTMDIFKALADVNRRKVIEALYEEDGLSIKQLTHGSTISRQAMTKHLNILTRSKIVTAEFSGKERVHKLKSLKQLRCCSIGWHPLQNNGM